MSFFLLFMSFSVETLSETVFTLGFLSLALVRLSDRSCQSAFRSQTQPLRYQRIYPQHEPFAVYRQQLKQRLILPLSLVFSFNTPPMPFGSA